MIDAADESRFEEVTEQYQALRNEPDLSGKPLLLICNKSDCSEFVGSDIMAMNLDLDVHSWCGPSTIIESSATLKTKSSVEKGLLFLLDAVHANYQEINLSISMKQRQNVTKRANQILLQKQRVQDRIDGNSSMSSSVIKAPGNMMKYVEHIPSVPVLLKCYCLFALTARGRGVVQ